MARTSAGLLPYRYRAGRLEVLLVHPGGPFWSKKEDGAWSIPKGEPEGHEDALEGAKREVEEELGFRPEGRFLELGEIRQRGGKTVRAWGFETAHDPQLARSNTFTVEWPPRSGKRQEFPEIDRAEFFGLEEAKGKINLAQAEFLTRLLSALGEHG